MKTINDSVNLTGDYLLHLNSIWHEKNFSDASKEIAKLREQARNVFLALEKLDEDNDLGAFKGKIPNEIEKAKQLLTEMNDISGGFNWLQHQLKKVAEDVVQWRGENK